VRLLPESKKKKSASDAPAEPRVKRRMRRKKPAEAEQGAKATKPTKAKEAKAEAPALERGRVHVYSLDGDIVKSVDLPTVFRGEIRSDLIRRAVTAAQANRRQPYGPGRRSGAKHSVRWSGKGHGVSRVPRIRGSMTGAQAPGTVGGRRAHPPRVEKVWAKKINDNERRLARNAALAAVKEVAIVAARGHEFKEALSLPVVIEDGIETLEPDGGATREGVKILNRLGVYSDVERAKEGRHVRAGRGKMRGRRYRQPRSLLVVVKDPAKVRRLFGNLPGIEVVSPAGLNAEVLAPGGDPGRLTLFSEGALEVLRSWSP
jgi:large subunit ribosomal protein L4e